MKQTIAEITTFAVLGLSIYLIWIFFQDYQFIYLIAGILSPIILLMMSSQYCAGNLFALIVIAAGLVGYIYLDEPYKLVSASVAAYIILFKIIRYGNELTGNYIEKNAVQNHDLLFLNQLLNSEWYQENKNKDPNSINPESLINQNFHQRHIGQIIQTLMINNMAEFSKSGYSKENLFKLHSTGIIHTLPRPISKNANGLISTGTQMLLNVFGNLESINNMPSSYIENEALHIFSTNQLVERSANEFGIVTDDEVNRIKNA